VTDQPTEPNEPADDGAQALADTLSAIVTELIASRLRVRALLELVEERELATRAEIDARTAAVFRRDWNDLAQQMLPPAVGPSFQRDWDAEQSAGV
jgi:hypothetical protein